MATPIAFDADTKQLAVSMEQTSHILIQLPEDVGDPRDLCSRIAADFVRTPEGKRVLGEGKTDFTWDDFARIPKAFLALYGVSILDDGAQQDTNPNDNLLPDGSAEPSPSRDCFSRTYACSETAFGAQRAVGRVYVVFDRPLTDAEKSALQLSLREARTERSDFQYDWNTWMLVRRALELFKTEVGEDPERGPGVIYDKLFAHDFAF